MTEALVSVRGYLFQENKAKICTYEVESDRCAAGAPDAGPSRMYHKAE